MLLEDLNPLKYSFSLDDLSFKAEDFDDQLISFVVKDDGGLKRGAFSVTYDENGENVDYSDSEHPGTLDTLRKHYDNHAISREINRIVKSTF